ncbi:MAG: hypothetical protein A2X53_16325 [Candidatus Rokubacteria bacterium GWA2_70_23]|nr:MAG: hypothetical protein A2X53_16325 [Candidatus Rokubacteria bacterium GWA2_70_23]
MSWSRTFLSWRERVRTAYQRGIWLDSTVPSSMGLEGWFRDVSRIPQSTIAFPLPRSRITDWRAPGGREIGAGPIAQLPEPLGGGKDRGGGLHSAASSHDALPAPALGSVLDEASGIDSPPGAGVE